MRTGSLVFLSLIMTFRTLAQPGPINIGGHWDLSATWDACLFLGNLELEQVDNMFSGTGDVTGQDPCQISWEGQVTGMISGTVITLGLTTAGEDTVDFTGALAPTLDSMSGTWSVRGEPFSGEWTAVRSSGSALAIRNPGAGITWVAGEEQTIEWNVFGVSTIDILYSTDYENGSGTFSTIVSGHDATTLLYEWHVPDTLLSRRCVIWIYDSQNAQTEAESPLFNIKPYLLTRIDADDDYEPFQVGQDGWSFSNRRENMWPETWWQQFNYDPISGNIDPNTGSRYPSDFTSFPIWASPDDWPDWVMFARAFGADQCYWGLTPPWTFYSPGATIYWGIVSRNWGGSCAGFAASSFLAFDHKDDFISRFEVPSFADLHDLTLDDVTRRVVNELWVYQWGVAGRAAAYLRAIASPTTALETLKEMLMSEAADNQAIGYQDVFSWPIGGHLMNPYKVEADPGNPDLEYIYVYDNNAPDATTPRITVDKGAGTWSYGSRSSSVGLFLDFSSSAYLEHPRLPTSPFGRSDNPLAGLELFDLYLPTTASAMISDSQGNELIYDHTDTLLTNTIPDVVPYIPLTGYSHPPVSYFMPTGEYSCELNGFSDETVRVAMFTDSLVLYYGRQDADVGQTDILSWDGGIGIRNPDTTAKQINVGGLVVEPEVSEKVIRLLNCSLAAGDSVRFLTVDHDRMRFENHGGATSYDLVLRMVTETSTPRFEALAVPVEPNSSHQIAPDWSDLSVVPIYVDLGNNGTFDDTLHIGNAVSVESQGSPEIPASFRLEQNYPNPFNPTTRISYAVPEQAFVTLQIFNILGQEVATLVTGLQDAGYRTVEWNAGDIASGVYLYRMEARSSTTHSLFVDSKKMLLVR